MSDDPPPAEVLLACEVLLRAGYTVEAREVMATLPLARADATLRAMAARIAELQAIMRGQRERAALQREDDQDG